MESDQGHCSALGRWASLRVVLWLLRALSTPSVHVVYSRNSLPQVSEKPPLVKQTNKKINCPLSFQSWLWSQGMGVCHRLLQGDEKLWQMLSSNPPALPTKER